MRIERARRLAALLVALCLLLSALSCGKSADDEEDAEGGAETETEATLTPYKPSGNESTVTGRIAFEGAPPAPKPISMDQDPVCSSTNPNAAAEDLVVNNGSLQNVFVYVKDGRTADQKNINSFAFTPPSESKVLDQRGCHYVPHVLGLMAKQKLTITNSDATSHNVNAQAAKNEKFNQGQGPGAPAIDKVFARSEILVPVKCNQHPWMKSYIGVLSHPFFAVTGPDGRFEITGLPPGTYTLVAWHEKLGEKTQSITVGAKESKEQNFSYAGGATAMLEGGSLQLMPALEFPLMGHQQMAGHEQ